MPVKNFLIKILRGLGLEVTIKKASKFSDTPKKVLRDKEEQIIQKISKNREILNGPFKGIKYIDIEITEASLLPKIVGCYERQLHPIIQRPSFEKYKQIIDIGCAEGYYALGLAKKLPGAKVFAYDINVADLEKLHALAKHNGITNIDTFEKFDDNELKKFDLNNKTLIFCDCEGYEFELFNTKTIDNLKNVDLIIEVHDFNVEKINAKKLFDLFSKTHDIEVVNNFWNKPEVFSGIDMLDKEEKELCFMEHRGGYYKNYYMEWFYITSKK